MFSTKKKVTAAITLGLASAFVLAGCSMGGTTTTDEPSDSLTVATTSARARRPP